MNNIYVDEVPDSCFYCDFFVRENYCCWLIQKDAREYRDDCPLIPLSDRLAEERKKVVDELKADIRSLFNSYANSLLDYCIWSINAYTHKKLYNNFKRVIKNRLDKVLDLFDKRIDQIERGVK